MKKLSNLRACPVTIWKGQDCAILQAFLANKRDSMHRFYYF